MYEDIVTLRDIDDELNELEEFTVVQLGDADGITSENLVSKDQQKTSGSASATTKNQKKTTKTKKDKTTSVKNGKGTKTSVSSSHSAGKGGAGGGKDSSSSSSKKKLQGLLVLRPRSVGVDATGNPRISTRLVSSPYITPSFVLNSHLTHVPIIDYIGDNDEVGGSSTNVGIALPPLIIGRSSKQNDRVSFEVAKEHHLWFHVQGSPGSHCLLQLDPGDKGRASEECLQYAAGLFSPCWIILPLLQVQIDPSK